MTRYYGRRHRVGCWLRCRRCVTSLLLTGRRQ